MACPGATRQRPCNGTLTWAVSRLWVPQTAFSCSSQVCCTRSSSFKIPDLSRSNFLIGSHCASISIPQLWRSPRKYRRVPFCPAIKKFPFLSLSLSRPFSLPPPFAPPPISSLRPRLLAFLSHPHCFSDDLAITRVRITPLRPYDRSKFLHLPRNRARSVSSNYDSTTERMSCYDRWGRRTRPLSQPTGYAWSLASTPAPQTPFKSDQITLLANNDVSLPGCYVPYFRVIAHGPRGTFYTLPWAGNA
ncbi:hypothetical protein F4861DRAFT_47633 [Xylaria intraflava]|nr:hypothetical protein F4861DRAFT_47633 [Xylaria intraflava]